jgi:hypothetical protein
VCDCFCICPLFGEGHKIYVPKFVNDAVSVTDLIHGSYRRMTKAAFETHCVRAARRIVMRVAPTVVSNLCLRVRQPN